MFDALTTLSPVLLALIATLFTWGVTALGAASVFLSVNFNQKVLDTLLGFTAGVMMAASFWSLLAPSIELSEAMGLIPLAAAADRVLTGRGVPARY
jgi:ZIP family zinc transporter